MSCICSSQDTKHAVCNLIVAAMKKTTDDSYGRNANAIENGSEFLVIFLLFIS